LKLKFMQTLEADVYHRLSAIAKERGITVQELLRAVILPEWMAKHASKPPRSKAARTRRSVARLIV